MTDNLTASTKAELLAENARLRRLVQILHDCYCPPDSERFPDHGRDVVRVFWMMPLEQDEYWYTEACAALGISAVPDGVPEWNTALNICAVWNTDIRRDESDSGGKADV